MFCLLNRNNNAQVGVSHLKDKQYKKHNTIKIEEEIEKQQ